MILIVSNNNEGTTTEVIKWLYQMKKEFIRVDEDEIFDIKMFNNKLFLQGNTSSFFVDDITSVWYRRGGIKFRRLRYTHDSVNLHMNEVQHWLEDYVFHTLEEKRTINKQRKIHLNKLMVLEKAKEAGLDVPKFFLSNKIDGDVKLGKTIVKPLAGNPILQSITEDCYGVMYTAIVDENIESEFFISFFQEKIEKDFEIRTFYLNGKCWSTAIFSQNDDQTKVDFRKYNDEKPNRNLPYRLPEETERRCKNLMEKIGLNCGSLDFIKKGEKYFFLEVNPVGQFLAPSDNCNYSLDKLVADSL